MQAVRGAGWKIPRARVLGFTGVLLLLCPGLGLAEDIRTWADASGLFKLQAEYVSHDSAGVTLKAADGQLYQIPLSSLSASDRVYAESHVTRPEGAPAEGVEKGPSAPPAAPAGPRQPVTVRGGARGVKDVSLSGGEEPGWNAAPAGLSKLAYRAEQFRLPKFEFGEDATGFVLSRNGLWGVLTSELRDATRVTVLDMAKGKVALTSMSPGEYLAIAINEEGSRIAVKDVSFEARTSGHGSVVVSRVKPKEFEIEGTIIPFADMPDSFSEVTWASFLAGDRLALLGPHGKLSLWNLENYSELCKIKPTFEVHVAPTVDGKLLAMTYGGDVALFDVENQKCLGTQDIHFFANALAFSPSGKRLLAYSLGQMAELDAATGEVINEITTVSGSGHDRVEYVSETMALAGNNALIDLENHLRLWDYSGRHLSACAGGVTFFAIERNVSGNDQMNLVPMSLPHKEAADALEGIRNRPEDFPLRPGGPVAIDLSGVPEEFRETVRAALMEKVSAHKFQVAPTAPAVIVARIEGPVATSVGYTLLGPNVRKKTDLDVWTSTVAVKLNGQDAWSHKGTNRPSFIAVDNDSDIQGLLKSRNGGPNLKVFETARVPRLLARPPADPAKKNNALGQTFVR